TTTVGSTSTTQSPTTTRPTPSTTQPKNSLPVTIFIDGWSYRTLQGVDLYLQSENALTPLPLDFQPLTPPEITELRTAQPDWVARIFARMVGADFNWACDASGCSSAAREVSAQDVTLYMLNPADIPGFGEVYGAWDVSSGIYAARSWLPIETEAF